MHKIDAYLPCFNNVSTLSKSIESVWNQTLPINKVVVVDDGSTDRTADVAQQAGAIVIRWESNRGRGAARRRAMEECDSEFVLALDGNKTLPRDFVEKALAWFEDPSVAAVFGRFRLASMQTASERWSTRHLYQTDRPQSVRHHVSMMIGGALCRRAAFDAVGSFSENCTGGEDREISGRLFKHGYDIVFDPQLEVCIYGGHNFRASMERFCRWRLGEAQFSMRDYCRHLAYAIKVMAKEDLSDGDPGAAVLSLMSPQYLLWYSRARQ